MEGVNHVHIVEVSSRSLVGDIHRMFERQIPDRESLKFGITSTDASFVFVVKLRETSCHLAATRTRSSHDDQFARGFDIVVFTKALIGGNEFHIVRIAVNGVVDIRLDTHALQTVAELVCCVLSVIMGNHDGTHHEVTTHELVAQTEYILVVGNTQVCAYFVLLNIISTDHNHNLYAVTKLGQHTKLTVRFKPWQYA